MCQRAAIAVTHAAGASLRIADEPTKGLDAARRDGVVDRLRREVEQGRLLLTITHDVEVAAALSGMIGVMLDGALGEFGPALSGRVLHVEYSLTASGRAVDAALSGSENLLGPDAR